MTGYDYVLYEQIQNCKERYYRSTGKRLSFPDTIRQLRRNGEIQHGMPEKPDFLSWDLSDINTFKNLLLRIPVSTKSLEDMSLPPIYDNAMFCSPLADAVILLESCYSKHEFCYSDTFCVIYILWGSCTLHLKTGSHTMHKGELCIIPPRIPYFVSTTEDDLAINIITSKNYFQMNFVQILRYDTMLSAFFRHALLEDERDCQFFFLPPDTHIHMLIQHLFAEFLTFDTYYSTAFTDYLQLFFLCIIRSTETTYEYYSDQKQISARVLTPSILEYITKHYRTLTLQELSLHFHYDSTYMSKLVMRHTGRSYRSIVTELKLNEAKKLLESTDLSITHIAKKAGFHSADALTYTMRKSLGVTPSDYRLQHR